MKLIRRHHPTAEQSGFTLIETILTMVITGILAGMVAVFIAGPVKGYVDTVMRGDLTDAADLALRRISREVTMALPGSLRVTTSGGMIYVEFIATSAGGAYLSELDATGANHPLVFSNDGTCTATTNCQFDVLGNMPASPGIAVGDYIVVYNQGQDSLGNSNAPADAYATGDPCIDCNRASVADVTGNTVTLVANAAGANVFASRSSSSKTRPLSSPSDRFHVVPGGVQAVTFACPTAVAGNLLRYSHYGFFTTAAAAIAAMTATPSVIVVDNATCAVAYTGNASQRNGLVSVSLTLRDASGNEHVTLMREIHLDNSP